ncbi:hypothetical protein N7462_009343 [Penicillium macrosclerotiorum]|uniref:uncharacterized protein n=1 Tax=Penicillium macrosclerotiorum TaxID=303699 RepID=UPI002547D3EC|nr:uncharacterized protein N7462_009343 [Penicillium macrosclerotiorum]KAJ5673904.1 hypothetical protein N7462_009343 [Penicillium macrosclerotiorum]
MGSPSTSVPCPPGLNIGRSWPIVSNYVRVPFRANLIRSIYLLESLGVMKLHIADADSVRRWCAVFGGETGAGPVMGHDEALERGKRVPWTGMLASRRSDVQFPLEKNGGLEIGGDAADGKEHHGSCIEYSSSSDGAGEQDPQSERNGIITTCTGTRAVLG